MARPSPVSPSIAQGVIAALTFIHAGVIGYAIKQEVDAKSETIIINGVRPYVNCNSHEDRRENNNVSLHQNVTEENWTVSLEFSRIIALNACIQTNNIVCMDL